MARSKWKEKWRNVGNHKLITIKKIVEPLKINYNTNWQWERKFRRLRIRHTRMTHEHLMSDQCKKYCMNCIVSLTVQLYYNVETERALFVMVYSSI